MSQMWEVLVPTVRPNTNGTKFFTTRFHRTWDDKVRAILGGLTILPPSKGQWVSPTGELFRERMIPVRIMCSKEQIQKIIDITLTHYHQEAVLAYKVSDDVILRFHPTIKNQS